MESQASINFSRITEAIRFINENFNMQPNLDEVAKQVHLSPAHFQWMFTEWAGTSPKKFLQYISLAHAKKMLKEEQATLFDTAFSTGLSGTSRLHDMFISIEGMTPAEYKNGGKSLTIHYRFAETCFGPLIVATTPKGVCYMAFTDGEDKALQELKLRFPNATYLHQSDQIQQDALRIFQTNRNAISQIKLHLKGTGFQLKVWESLLKIPKGRLSTYGKLAARIGNPNASRGVGTAIGSNPVAFLIPCHRVIQSTGHFGGYMWGAERKAAIIGWEGIQTNPDW